MTMTAEDRARWEAKIARQSSYVDFIMETAKTDPLEAAVMLLTGLMAGNREELRLGYSIGNALIATLEQLKSQAGVELTQGQIGALIEKVAVPKPGLVEYGPVMNEVPQVYVNVSGGIAEITVMRGDADVIHADWDNLNETLDFDLLLDTKEEFERLAPGEYKERLLADIEELIHEHPDYEAPTLGLEGDA